MGLKEKAIEEYNRDRELIVQSNEREAEIFAERAFEELKKMLGNEYIDIMSLDKRSIIVDKQPGAASFRIDGMLFRVISSQGFYVVDVVIICPVCGTETYNRIFGIKNIGKALVEPHSKYDCDRALEMKKENGGESMVLSTEGRLLEALKEFIRENCHD